MESMSWWWLLPLGVAAGGAIGLGAVADKLRDETEALIQTTAELRRRHPFGPEK
jgi:hypothetical protein